MEPTLFDTGKLRELEPGRRSRKPRPQDLLFNEICRVFSLSPRGSNATRIARLAALYVDRGATPDQIEPAAQRYRGEWPSTELTPEALEKHWDRFKPGAVVEKPKRPDDVSFTPSQERQRAARIDAERARVAKELADQQAANAERLKGKR